MPPLSLHNAMWPGLVGKGPDASEPAIGLERMLRFTADARIEGEASVRFDGVDLFLYHPHIDIDAPGRRNPAPCGSHRIAGSWRGVRGGARVSRHAGR